MAGAGYLLGRSGVAVLGSLRCWAERGLVHCEDARDNSYKSISVREALRRMKALNDMLGKSQADRKGFLSSAQVESLQTFVEDMIEVCRKAREQGEPTDQRARLDLLRRQPKTVIMPGTKEFRDVAES